MRIGIVFHSNKSLWSCGSNQTAFHLADLFVALHHDVILVHQFPDITSYESIPHGCTISELSCVSTLDWLIDIDGYLSQDIRKKAATHTIVFLRTFLQFEEMNASVYLDYPFKPRNMEDVYEIWCWDILNPEESIPSIQTLFSCPIRRVPFIWSPSLLQHMSANVNCTYNKDELWTVHVSEKNMNTSSTIIPLCAIKELVHTYHIPATYRIHDIDRIKDNQFFKENILANIESDTLPISYESAEPWHQWNHNAMMISHLRFVSIRPSLLQVVWLGIPLIHNSPVLATLHPMLEKMFYTGNNIQELCTAVTSFLADVDTWTSVQQDIKNKVMERFGIVANLPAWETILTSLPVSSVETPILSHTGTIIIAFSNMWEGFNYDSNFIMDSVRHTAPHLSIKGVPYSVDSNVSLVICGPHGQLATIPHGIPKVYYSAENWALPQDDSFSLYLTNSVEENDTHMRIPTWMMFIDWFTAETHVPQGCTDNPIRFPLSMAMQPHPIPFQERKEFCAFVVSNPSCTMRNEAFYYVNGYKKVNSGGALYNNIGGQLSLKYPGGGCGDVSKYDFFSNHQFTLSFENSQSAGYLTEKVLHAKMAGCVPLYWGSKQTESDFVPHSFINVSAISSAESVVDIIKKLESRPDLCSTIAATPILDETRKKKALDKILVMSHKLLALAIHTAPTPSLPCIDKTFVVNLDSRPDRWDSLIKTEPVLKQLVTRVPAVNGKTLQMTRAIYKRYKNNPFQWKKAIIGCYMSHIKIWKKILDEKGDFFLVLEDDVRFVHGWTELWKNAANCIPSDAELLYWGGVLPPNKAGLSLALEPVNSSWAHIRPNTLFSKEPLPFFHFCTYSYVITKAGARKLLDYIEKLDGMPYSGCDHLLGHARLQTYVAHPLLALCAQEEDPAYVHSEFNNLHREDNFDSDIWNNNDCFSIEDVTPFFDETAITLYYHSSDNHFELYERAWLQDMFQRTISCRPFVSLDDVEEDAWFLFQRPHSSYWTDVLMKADKPFRLLHLSDEFGTDVISIYTHPLCKGVIRNYTRPDVPVLPHILTIPLGYHYRPSHSQTMEERQWIWSFHGTDWFERSQQLAEFQTYHPYSCRLQPDWNHPSGTKEEEYLDTLRNSQFCPILKGNNMETFRLYEALEAGTLPLFGPSISSDFITWIQQHIDVSALYDWTNLESMNVSMDTKTNAQLEIVRQWAAWKDDIRVACKNIIE